MPEARRFYAANAPSRGWTMRADSAGVTFILTRADTSVVVGVYEDWHDTSLMLNLQRPTGSMP